MIALAIGEIVVDWLTTGRAEKLEQACDFRRAPGGNAVNFAIGLARLGQPVRLVGQLGEDLHAVYLREALAREQVDLSFLLSDPRYPTAQCYCLTTPDGEHKFYNWPRPNAADLLQPEQISAVQFAGVSLLHCTGVSLVKEPRSLAIEAACEIACERGVVVSFDAMFPTGAFARVQAQMERVLHKAHIIKCNRHEAVVWAQGQAGDPIAHLSEGLYRRFNPLVAVVTAGREGSYIYSDKGLVHCPPADVEVVGEIGAGDAYSAGFAHALMTMLPDGLSPTRLRRLTAQQWQLAGMSGSITGALATRCLAAAESAATINEFETQWQKMDLESMRNCPLA